MTGRSAAYKVAMRNARRNRKRTIFLVLLVAVPVGFGVVVAGIVRASTLTPEERAQSNFGAADARFHVFSPTDEVYEWVGSNLDELAPGATITELRQTGVQIEDVGYAQVWDLDMSEPATRGFLVQVSGDMPSGPNQVAISPTLAEKMDVVVGDTFEFEQLPFGDLEVVGLVSQPYFVESADVLLSPGSLKDLVGDPELLPEPSLLVSGPHAEAAAMLIGELWYSEGQELFWPEPPVDPIPPELSFLEEDPYIFLQLNESDVDRLVDLARNAEPGPGQTASDLVYDAAWQMIYGRGQRAGLPEIYVETRTQLLRQGFLGAENPAVLSTAAAAIALVEVAFITGAAFAAGTRRRLREIGLMGANGASTKHIKSTVVGEGLTIGAVGAGAGVVLGVTIMIVGRPILQRFVSRVITGVGVDLTDVLGPVLVALVAVLLAVLIPARTASKVPTTTALQGRMPALAPRKWIIPVGVGLAGLGGLLVSVSLASQSNFAGLLVGIGATAVVGGVAMLSSPILAGVARLSDKVPATSRLVLRDSGRNRTRSAVAVAATMVILLAPVTAMTTSATSAEKNLVYGLPPPDDQLILNGTYDRMMGDLTPLVEADVAALAAIVPEDDVAVFDTLDLFVVTNELLEVREAGTGDGSENQQFSDGLPVAVANDDLVRVLGDTGVTRSIQSGEIVVLGIEDKETRVEISGVEYSAHEYPVAVMQWSMPRVIIPEAMAGQFAGVETRPVALYVLERSMTSDEEDEMWASNLSVSGGSSSLDEGTIYLLMGAATLVVVLIVVALVTAVSAAEVDHEVRTMVAVGAPGSIRRRFLGLLTGYQTMVAMVLAVPLGLGLVWVFSSAQDYIYAGPFGLVDGSAVTVPWAWILSFAVILPIVIGLLTLISVRSAPVTPPRRAT